jgi:hypothetical protein
MTSDLQSSWTSDFPRLAREAFDFLIEEYGYDYVGGDERTVVWRSRSVEVSVQLDVQSREVDVLLRPRTLTRAGILRALKGDRATPLSLGDIAAWREAAYVLERLPGIVDPPAVLPQRLKELAESLRNVGDPLLRGEMQNFRAADRHITEHAARMTREFGRR